MNKLNKIYFHRKYCLKTKISDYSECVKSEAKVQGNDDHERILFQIVGIKLDMWN